MRDQLVEHPLGSVVSKLAARQHGVVEHSQLVELGMSKHTIGRWVRAGRLHRVHRGVFAVGHPRLTPEGRFLAAVFACGPGAVLSHESAAVLWGLRQPRGPRIDVTAATRGGRSRRGALISHRSTLEPEEVTVKDGVPVTSAARTVLDLADVLRRRPLERVLDEAFYLGLDLEGLTPRRGRRGFGLLTAVLAEHEAGTTWTRSALEERMLTLCRRRGLPAPVVNGEVGRWELDFHWPDQRLAVETDAWSSHGGRGAFERDRLKDAQLVEAGWRVVRITRARLAREPREVAALLARLLSGDR
jgi:very-short-patch-repair endonuclease